MTSDISTALTLLVIGMITVFIVLFLVVLTGNLLIMLVNRYSFSEKRAEEDGPVDSRKIAAIVAAAEVITSGEGSVSKIEEIK